MVPPDRGRLGAAAGKAGPMSERGLVTALVVLVVDAGTKRLVARLGEGEVRRLAGLVEVRRGTRRRDASVARRSLHAGDEIGPAAGGGPAELLVRATRIVRARVRVVPVPLRVPDLGETAVHVAEM